MAYKKLKSYKFVLKTIFIFLLVSVVKGVNNTNENYHEYIHNVRMHSLEELGSIEELDAMNDNHFVITNLFSEELNGNDREELL